MMRKSLFLSEIAKTHNPKIDHVSFCKPESIENCLGQAFARKSFEGYRVLLNENLLFCPDRVFWVFFHEIGHIVLGHLKQTDTERSSQLKLERAADEWAFNQMGIFDRKGEVKKERALCFECIKGFSSNCLKGQK